MKLSQEITAERIVASSREQHVADLQAAHEELKWRVAEDRTTALDREQDLRLQLSTLQDAALVSRMVLSPGPQSDRASVTGVAGLGSPGFGGGGRSVRRLTVSERLAAPTAEVAATTGTSAGAGAVVATPSIQRRQPRDAQALTSPAPVLRSPLPAGSQGGLPRQPAPTPAGGAVDAGAAGSRTEDKALLDALSRASELQAAIARVQAQLRTLDQSSAGPHTPAQRP
jgi:hypothetical protein